MFATLAGIIVATAYDYDTSLIAFLSDPLYREAVITATVAGLCLGLLGVYVVSRRMVFISAALAQSAALGATLGFIAIGYFGFTGLAHDVVPVLSAIILSFAVVAALVGFGERPTLSRDAILGIAFIVPMAIIFVLLPLFHHELHEIDAIISGVAVVVEPIDMYAIIVATIVLVGVQIYGFRAFVFASLDPLVARTQGVPVRLLDAILFGSIALMTGLVARALGPLPTFGLTVLPAIGALGLNIGLKRVFVVAAFTGAFAGGLGYYFAFVADWSVGATQTLTAAGLALLLRLIGLIHHKIAGRA